MSRPRVTVYVVKDLFWCYNDECTVPMRAKFTKAFRSREQAKLYRRELELKARSRDNPASEGNEPLETQWDDARVGEWLTRFGLDEPPRDPVFDQRSWGAEWLARAEAQLGRDEFLRFCELFDAGAYNYHVVETELEL